MILGGFNLGLGVVSLNLNNLLQLEVTVGNNGGILGLEIPDFPSDFGSDSNPMAFRVEGQSSDGGLSVVDGERLLNIAEIEDSNLKVLTTGHNEVSSGGHGQSVNVGIMGSEGVLDVESLVVPDLEVSVPSD